MTTKFLEWAVRDASPSQREAFLSVYSEELTNTVPNFNPNTAEKIELWEAYCAAVNIDPALPGSSPPVFQDHTPAP